MSGAKVFFDTNILLYLLSSDQAKIERVEARIADARAAAFAVISVQVLNEFANVARRKMRLEWPELHETLSALRDLFRTQSLTPEVHDLGLAYSQRYQLSIFDGQILASAKLAGCATVYSEDMQHGQRIADTLVIRNPFVD